LKKIIASAEKFVSFGGICGVIGVVSDLLEPVTNAVVWSLIGGVAILLAGLTGYSVFGFRNEITKTAISFGVLLTMICGWFQVGAPEEGKIAANTEWGKDLQSQLVEMTASVRDIKTDTGLIASNTSDISSSAQGILDASWDSEKFSSVVLGNDFQGMKAGCARGYRVTGDDLLYHPAGPEKYNAFRNEEKVDLLLSQNCVDTATLCRSEYSWFEFSAFYDKRIARVCGEQAAENFRSMKNVHDQKRTAALEEDRIKKEAKAAIAGKEKEECLAAGADETLCETVFLMQTSNSNSFLLP
jgi:hypothetical protein